MTGRNGFYLVVGFMAGVVFTLMATSSEAAECPRSCTEERIAYYATLSPLEAVQLDMGGKLQAAVRSVGYVCDTLAVRYVDSAPGAKVYHVTCNGRLHYTVGDSRARTVVWPGDFSNY